MSSEDRCSRECRNEPMLTGEVKLVRVLDRVFTVWSDLLCASFSCARLLCEMALWGMAGTGSSTSSCTCLKLAIEADFLSGFPGAAKYPERWFGVGEVGEDATEEASVSVVSLEACEEARERVDTLWSESSADDWLRTVMDETFLSEEISGAL